MDYLDIIKPGLAVGIIDADLLDNGTRHPNLALMKISAYCKQAGCFTELLESYANTDDYDAVFVSRVFSFTKVPDDLCSRHNVYVGGTGFYADGGENLPYEIEHIKPDYKLYEDYVEKQIAKGRRRAWFADYLDYSIGFTTRGCFRKCSFCVNQKYDRAFLHSPVNEFLDLNRPCIYLWDDNVFACAQWEAVFDDLIATGKPFQFRQGLDIRLLTKRKAQKLARVKYAGDYIFAFDHIEDRELIEEHLKIWRTYSDKGTRLYVLCAFDSQDEVDIENTLERIKILMGYGCLPYIMRYESYKTSKWRTLYVNLARWCNQPQFFKKKSFRQFCEANQDYHKSKETLCSAMQALKNFEAEFPEIAARYFDLRFEDRNMFMRYGRSFSGKPSEEISAEQGSSWSAFAAGQLSDEEAVRRYYAKTMDIVWLEHYGDEEMRPLAEKLFEILKAMPIATIFECVCLCNDEPITPANIPQFSDVKEIGAVAATIEDLQEHLPYEAIGIYLDPAVKKSSVANKKYGENHGKLAALLDVACVELCGAKNGCQATLFTPLFARLSGDEQMDMIAKLSFRIPIIASAFRDAVAEDVSINDYLVILSESTRKRRLSNIMKLVSMIEERATADSSLKYAALSVRR